MSQENIERIKEESAAFPRQPGVYIMKDCDDKPIYIGKSVDIRNRIRSYLFDRDDRRQVPALLARLHHIDWIVTANESEALVLEANLVRKFKPRYNIDLRDDKHYPYLKLTVNEDFPRLLIVRRTRKDGARYFGPYTDSENLRKVMSFVKKAFKISDCKKVINPDVRRRPCLNYAIGRCGGACAAKISKQEYAINVGLIEKFLAGRQKDVIKELRMRMEEASMALNFEQAAALRDQVAFISTAFRPYSVDLRSEDINIDVFGTWCENRSACLCVLCFREGVLVSKRHFLFNREDWNRSNGDRERLIIQFYQDSVNDAPGEILLAEDSGCDTSLLEQWFASDKGVVAGICVPVKGKKRELVEMARQNARHYLIQKSPPYDTEVLLELQRCLCLPEYPGVIEAFDISNLGKSFAVAGMVRFVDGKPDKAGYRRFKIKSISDQNDFAMIFEAVDRRLARLRKENREFPDLLLIDGGRGQLNSAMKALEKFGKAPMIISLAKKEEVLFSPYTEAEVTLPPENSARKLVQRIRDEVHRFAITYHRTIRDKQFKRSSLEDIPGIGPVRAGRLIRKFGSIEGLRLATLEELVSVGGITAAAAEKIRKISRNKA
jgi:excinuclease ABC subunit C